MVDQPLNLRERKKLRTREALTDAALELFATKGFAATTLDDLVDAVDVSKRTFFRNFSSKEDVALGPSKKLWTQVITWAATRPIQGPLLSALCDLLAEAVRTVADGPALLTMHQLENRTPALHAYGLEYCSEVQTALVDTLTERIGADRGLPLPLIVEVLIAAWHCAVQDWLAADGADGYAGLADRVRSTVATLPECLTVTAPPADDRRQDATSIAG